MDNIKTGKFIAQCRHELGLTQQELADRLNLSNKTISKWESGAGSPDISNLPELANTLGITVDELLNGERSSAKAEAPAAQNSAGKKCAWTWTPMQIFCTVLGLSAGAVLGILAYNYGWLG
ncbi:MAG: helix-turn-helix transcriptional regulator [Clostridia bacterium]|nr:helix-turn-helix transcriptional regulator [Clostridia bacterium]